MVDKFTDEQVILEENGYVLTESPDDNDLSYYNVYNENWDFIDGFEDRSLTDDDKEDIKSTDIYERFIEIVAVEENTITGWHDDNDSYDTLDDLDLKFLKANTFYDDKTSKLTPEEEKEIVESLCKSDTIVFHQTDPTTVMLDPIYDGKGFDVYKDSMWGGSLSRESIHELIKRHDRIVCLGHGTYRGLLSGVIGEQEVPLLKDKKIFSMWCYAATFWKDNGFEGHGILTSDNFPSEVWECKAACNANVSKEWIFDNMMLAGEIAGRAMDIGWENPQAGCDLFRKEYSEKSKVNTEDES